MTTNQPDADLVSRIEPHRLVMTGSGWGCHEDGCDWALNDDDAVLAVAWREFAEHLADALAPYIAERVAAVLEAAAVKLTDEADLLFTMAKQMGLPWTDARQAKASGYRESANLVRAAQHRSKP